MTYQGLGKVKFGHIAAEDEVNELQKYFIETEEYSAVISDKRKILVIGRKGSGKSAIYVALRDYLPKRDKSVVVEALTLNDYPWEVHKRVRDSGVPAEQSYVNSWKYIIWVLLSKKIVGYSQLARYKLLDFTWWKRRFDANRRFLYRFLAQNYGSVAPSFAELIADRSRQVRSLRLKDIGVEADKEEDAFQRLSRSINIINREIQSRVLNVLSSNRRYYLLFDQLDLGWDYSDETRQLLIGLILAARDIVRAAENENKQIHVVIFLRSDIYETLRFEDKNKISPDVVELRWNNERLQQLVSKRIEASANGTWKDVFTGDQMRSRVSQLSYIVKRTMLRPRDMIQFCVYAKDAAMELSRTRIDNDSIYEASQPYSDYMRKEIQDECKASIPEIDDLLGILQEIGLERTTRERFLEVCEAREINGELALRQLISLSLIGIYRAGGRGGGSGTIFRYQAQPWEQLDPTQRLDVHPSLKHALGLVEPRKRRER
jgi:energy-coupling factor transporter ATP-binding protein EcfA2